MKATPRIRHATAPRSETAGAAGPTAALALLAAALLLASPASAPARGRPLPGTALDVSVSTTYDALGRPAAVVHVRVPHRGLVFTREGEGYVAILQAAVVAERDGRRVGGGFAEAAARVAAYEATRSEERLACDVTAVLDGEGPVRLELTARVRGTDRVWRTDLRFDPGAGSGVPWYFAGFDWNVPASAQGLASAADTLRAAVTLVRLPGRDGAAPPAATSLVFRVTDAGGDERVVGREALPAAAADTLRRRLETPSQSLPFGPLRLDVSLETDGGRRLDLAPGRDLVNLRVDWRDDAAWRLHVDWLDGILDGDARRALAALPVAGRPEAWRAVWAARPAGEPPDEATHLMRIVEADRRFGQFGRGALSDRGRIHIQRGPPDSVEAQGMDLSYPGQWEVWYYRRAGVLYRFYDAYGLGDFRLYDTAPY
ncbi:MAG: GWxTD domain-containing protein [bacterium]|nr:GWxTD domain-containing protein [bacterium]